MKLITCTLVIALAAPAAAQPRVTNGEVRQAAVPGPFTRASLDAAAKAPGTAWLAYSVPIVDGNRWICDGSSSDYDYRVQDRRDAGGPAASQPREQVMMLEGARNVWVLFRLAAGQVDRIRVASEDCTLDAGGLPVQWMAGVTAPESVSVLATFLDPPASRRLANGALLALAMHGAPIALEGLMTAARDGQTPHVRAQALFWLAQRAGEKAIGVISDAIANDPETDVKRRAVFALSLLPPDEGVPRLIEVARTNSNPAVRKQAMFWLGQTKDPRALRFFEEVLFK